MSVVIAYEDAGPCRKRLTIEVPAPAVDAEIGRVVVDLSRGVQIAGFRKGKAPAALVRKRFKDQIEQEVKERLVPRYWRQAQAEKNLDPLLPPEVADLEIKAGEPMTFVASVEVRPDLVLRIDEPFELPAEGTEPTTDDIADQLEEIRRSHATWTTVERPASNGDRVLGTIRRQGDAADGDSADGDQPAPPESGPLEVVLGDQRVWEELTLALTGVAAGHSKTFTRTAGEGGEATSTRYEIDIREVQEQELPALDDAFAAQVGEGAYASLEALREAIGERLQQAKEQDLARRRQRALLDQLRDRHPLELPQRLVQQETEHILQGYLSQLAEQGIDPGAADLDLEALSSQMRPEAEKRVHERLVLDAVVEERDIPVDEQAFEGLLSALAAQHRKSTLALRQELSENGRLGPLRAHLRRDRAIRVLLGEESADDQTDENDQGAPDEASGQD